MTDLARTFAALSDQTRLALVEKLLKAGELPAGTLADAAPVSAPAISRHLKVLREAGILRARIDGTRRLYSVRPEALREISQWSHTHLAFWTAGLDRLETHLAGTPGPGPEGADGITD